MLPSSLFPHFAIITSRRILLASKLCLSHCSQSPLPLVPVDKEKKVFLYSFQPPLKTSVPSLLFILGKPSLFSLLSWMVPVDHKCVTLLRYISLVTSSKTIHSQLSTETSSCPQPGLSRPLIRPPQVILHSEPLLHLVRSPSQLANQARIPCFPASYSLVKTPHHTLVHHRSQSTCSRPPSSFTVNHW